MSGKSNQIQRKLVKLNELKKTTEMKRWMTGCGNIHPISDSILLKCSWELDNFELRLNWEFNDLAKIHNSEILVWNCFRNQIRLFVNCRLPYFNFYNESTAYLSGTATHCIPANRSTCIYSPRQYNFHHSDTAHLHIHWYLFNWEIRQSFPWMWRGSDRRINRYSLTTESHWFTNNHGDTKMGLFDP